MADTVIHTTTDAPYPSSLKDTHPGRWGVGPRTNVGCGGGESNPGVGVCVCGHELKPRPGEQCGVSKVIQTIKNYSS